MTFHDLEPNWLSSVRETYEFRTDILTTRSGKEQRRARRMTPRCTVEFNAMLRSGTTRGFLNSMRRRTSAPDLIPDFRQRPALSVADISLGSSEMFLDSIPSWLTGPMTVALVGSSATETVLATPSVSPAKITLATGSLSPWQVGTRIYPLIEGRFATDVTASFVTSDLATFPVRFDMTPGNLFSGGAPGALLGSNEVLRVSPNWGTTISATQSKPFELVDYGVGIVKGFDPIAFASRSNQMQFLRPTRSEVIAIKNFFLRMKGRRGEFWCPTWTSDLVPTAGVFAGQTGFRVRGKLADYNDTVLKGICVTTVSGDVLFLRVSRMRQETVQMGPGGPSGAFGGFSGGFDGSAHGGAGGTGSIGANQVYMDLLDPFPATLQLSQILKVSWMPLSRFAADSLTVEWITDGVAQILVNVLSLEALA